MPLVCGVQTLRENGMQLQSVSLSRACLGECVRLILGRMLGQREPHPASPRKPDAAAATSHADADADAEPAPTAAAASASALLPQPQPSAAASDAHSTSADTEHSHARFEDDAEFEHYFASRDERKFVCVEARLASIEHILVRVCTLFST